MPEKYPDRGMDNTHRTMVFSPSLYADFRYFSLTEGMVARHKSIT
jgi:hypothetical protein